MYFQISESSPLFTYKALRQQNRRIYNLLPEAQNPVHVKQKKLAVNRTNRLIGSLYSQVYFLKIFFEK